MLVYLSMCFFHYYILQELSPPLVDDFLYLCDDAYSRDQILAMEREVLLVLGYDINSPVAYRFLRRLARVSLTHTVTYICGAPNGTKPFCLCPCYLCHVMRTANVSTQYEQQSLNAHTHTLLHSHTHTHTHFPLHAPLKSMGQEETRSDSVTVTCHQCIHTHSCLS